MRAYCYDVLSNILAYKCIPSPCRVLLPVGVGARLRELYCLFRESMLCCVCVCASVRVLHESVGLANVTKHTHTLNTHANTGPNVKQAPRRKCVQRPAEPWKPENAHTTDNASDHSTVHVGTRIQHDTRERAHARFKIRQTEYHAHTSQTRERRPASGRGLCAPKIFDERQHARLSIVAKSLVRAQALVLIVIVNTYVLRVCVSACV